MSYLKRPHINYFSAEIKEVSISLSDLETLSNPKTPPKKIKKSPPESNCKSSNLKLKLDKRFTIRAKKPSISDSSISFRSLPNLEPARIELNLEDLKKSPSKLNEFLNNRRKHPKKSPSVSLINDFIDPDINSISSRSFISINPTNELLSSSFLDGIGNISPIQEVQKNLNFKPIEDSFGFTFENSNSINQVNITEKNDATIEKALKMIKNKYKITDELILVPRNTSYKIPQALLVWKDGCINVYDLKSN